MGAPACCRSIFNSLLGSTGPAHAEARACGQRGESRSLAHAVLAALVRSPLPGAPRFAGMRGHPRVGRGGCGRKARSS